MKFIFTTKRFRGLSLALGFILLTSFLAATAQRDLITTQAGEEIRCRIIDETPVRFVFTYLKDDKVYRSEIFKNLVTSFKYDYFKDDLPFAEKMPKSNVASADAQPTRALTQGNAAPKKVKNKSKRRNRKSIEVEEQPAVEVPKSAVVTKPEAVAKKEAVPPAKATTPTVTNTTSTTTPKKENTQRTPPPRVETIPQRSEMPQIDEVVTTKAKPANERTKESSGRSDNRTSQPASATDGKAKIADEKKANEKADAVKEEAPISIDKTELPEININQANKFRVGVKGGIGNRLDNSLQTTNTYDLYLEQLLRGYVFGADLGYFPTDGFGFGAIFTDFRSRNTDENITYRNVFTGNEATGSIGNRRSVKFVGPAMFLRKKLDYKTYVVLGLSPGYNFYTDNGNYDGLNYTFKGGGFGAASTLGVDFLLGNDVIGRDVILSFEAGYNYGKINALDYGDSRGAVALASPISINRLDFTVGLRFIRFPKYFRLTSY